MPRQTISPKAIESAIRTATTYANWVPARQIITRTGGSAYAVNRTLDALFRMGKLDRAWDSRQWVYRIKGAP